MGFSRRKPTQGLSQALIWVLLILAKLQRIYFKHLAHVPAMVNIALHAAISMICLLLGSEATMIPSHGVRTVVGFSRAPEQPSPPNGATDGGIVHVTKLDASDQPVESAQLCALTISTARVVCRQAGLGEPHSIFEVPPRSDARVSVPGYQCSGLEPDLLSCSQQPFQACQVSAGVWCRGPPTPR